jgi:hypothetical protein
MFVAIFEAMFQVRLKGIVRKPSHLKDYERNAQGVIDALGTSILNMDLSHISGVSIVKGDASAIMNLVDIFVGISEVWLKRRFQKDALSRGSVTRTRPARTKGAQQRPKSAAGKSAAGKSASVPKLNIPNAGATASSKSARTTDELHSDLASLATDYPKMWASLSERGTSGNPAEQPADPKKKPSRLEFLEARMMSEREAKQKSEYRRLLKDRLVALRRKDILEAKKQMFRQRGTAHAETVRNIKVTQQKEVLRRAQISARLRRKQAQDARMRKLHMSMIKSLHSSKREAELADAQKLKMMKAEGGARAQALDAFFAERIEMVNQHINSQETERYAQSRDQEGLIRQMLRELAVDSKARVEEQIRRAAEVEDEETRKSAEATLALAHVVGVEDWHGVYKDRFMTPTARSLNQVAKLLDQGKSETEEEKVVKTRESRKAQLRSAYGSGVGSFKSSRGK